MESNAKKRVVCCLSIALLLLSLVHPVTATADGNRDLSIRVGIRKAAGMSNASLQGTFIMCEFGTNPQWIGSEPLIVPNPWTGRLELTFDGSGNGTFRQLDDSNGYSDSGSFTYSVKNDGEFSVSGVEQAGSISADGNMFFLIDADTSDKDLSIHVGIRKPAGMSNSSLSGEFIVDEFGTDSAINIASWTKFDPWTGRVAVTLGGDGSGSYLQLDDSNRSSKSGSIAYSVDSEGKISVSGEGIVDIGIVNVSGDMFVLVDTNEINDTDDDLAIHVGIKKPVGMSNASLQGTFIIGEYGTAPEPFARRQELSFDGVGNGTFQQLADSRGDYQNGSFRYSVSGDGMIQIDGEKMEGVGIVNAEGNIFAIVDTTIPINISPATHLLLND